MEKFTQSQRGAMDRFISREPQVPSDNQTLGQNPALDINVDYDPSDVDQTQTETNIGAKVEDVLIDNTDIDMDDPPVADGDDSFQPDI